MLDALLQPGLTRRSPILRHSQTLPRLLSLVGEGCIIRNEMDVAQRGCQVVVRKINFGERAMQRCVVPVKKLQVGIRTGRRVARPKNAMHRLRLRKLTVLLRKFASPPSADVGAERSGSRLSKLQLLKLRVLLHKMKLEDGRSSSLGALDGEGGGLAGTLSIFQRGHLRVLLRKLNPRKGGVKESHKSMNQLQEETLKVLATKLKPTKRESFIVNKSELSDVPLHRVDIPLQKVKVACGGCQTVAEGASASETFVSCPQLPRKDAPRFRVLVKRLKLRREIQEQLDHTIFIDDKLGFVVNPYLIPGFHCSKTLGHSGVKVLKIGRRTRAGRCRVRLRKLQL